MQDAFDRAFLALAPSAMSDGTRLGITDVFGHATNPPTLSLRLLLVARLTRLTSPVGKSNRASPLATRTEPGAPSALRQALDRSPIVAPATLPLAVVDIEALREIAKLAIGPGVVAQRRTTRFDRLAQH